MRPGVLAAAIIALAAATNGCGSTEPAPAPAPSPSPDRRIVVLEEPDARDPDAHTMRVITGLGFADSVASHAFNNGVVQVGVRGARWTTDERLRLCDVLIDELADTEKVKQILVTSASAPVVHWNAPDMQCVADPSG